MVCRDEHGTLRAFINACKHKGARIAEGFGQSTRLVCKFHGWTYTNDGALYHRPQEACFNQAGKDCNLNQLPVSVQSGLIVVGTHSGIEQNAVDSALAEIEQEFSGFSFENMHSIETRRLEVNANWKLVAGLSHEAYHFATLHRDSVANVLTANAVYDTFGKHSRWAFPMRGIEKLQDKPEAQWPNHIEGAINHTIFPGTVVIKNPEDAQIIRIEPGKTVDTSVIYYTGVCLNKANMESARAAFEFGGEVFEKEDLPAATQCQQGLNATSAPMIIGTNEPVVQFWHKLWKEILK